jgi:hypothetical protein
MSIGSLSQASAVQAPQQDQAAPHKPKHSETPSDSVHLSEAALQQLKSGDADNGD